MDGERRIQLETIMAALAVDEAAVVALYESFGEEIRAIVRFEVGLAGPGAASADDMEAMVFDSCLTLAKVAGGWRADGGALPWVWGRARITATVRAALPQPTRPLPDEADLPPAPPLLVEVGRGDDDLVVTLDSLAAGRPLVAMLAVALREAVGEGDAAVFLRYRIQQQSGDPSAANTVARELGLRPPAVRQRVSRARRRLAAHVAANPQFAALAELPLLSAAA